MDWDQVVHGKIHNKWTDFYEDLPNIHLITIQRLLETSRESKIQLHGFCDVSEKGYGAVLYARVKKQLSLNEDFLPEEEKYSSQLIASKSRVAPLKIISLPRLELCAANLLVNLIETVAPLFEEKIEIFCWTDSEIWVSGSGNPADLISRGATFVELNRARKWWHGPRWLENAAIHWPNRLPAPIVLQREEALREVRAIHLVNQNPNLLMRGNWFRFNQNRQDESSLITTYGSWDRLVRVTATVFRAAYNFKSAIEILQPKKSGKLEPDELLTAQKYLIRADQERSFPKETLSAQQRATELIGNLVVSWDKEDKCLRINGRIKSQNLTRDEQFPIVLDKHGALAPLLIQKAHLERKHGGNQLILQYLRAKYWIIGARSLVKNMTRKCPICFRLRMKTSEHIQQRPAEHFRM